MKIAVFCASAMGKDPIYRQTAEALGKWMAARGDELVYGGESGGTMGVIADAVLAGGSRVIGVLPRTDFFLEGLHPGLSETVYTDTLAERKDTMYRLADAFIALPGGPGTMDELADAMCRLKIGELDKPLILLDAKGFYQPLKTFFDSWLEEGFALPAHLRRVAITADFDEIAQVLCGSSHPGFF